MRIVFDNNVLISAALLKDSVPFKAFNKAITNNIIIRSHMVLEEFQNTIYKS